jgi:hypothetical protein
MSIFLLFKQNNSGNSDYLELQYLYNLLTKVKSNLRDDFSSISIDTKISTKQNRKSDKRDTFTGTLDQTLATVGSIRGYATRKNL